MKKLTIKIADIRRIICRKTLNLLRVILTLSKTKWKNLVPKGRFARSFTTCLAARRAFRITKVFRVVQRKFHCHPVLRHGIYTNKQSLMLHNRFPVKLGMTLLFLGLILLIAFKLISIHKVFAAPWASTMSDYLKRKQITLINNSGQDFEANTTYQFTINTKELFSKNDLQADCDDLRVVYQPSTSTATELARAYSVANGATNCSDSTTTVISFPLQSSITNGSSDSYYYIYYSNSTTSAPTASAISAFNIGAKSATFVAPFNGTTTALAVGSTAPTTATGAIRYSGGKSALNFRGTDTVVTPSFTSSTTTATFEGWFYFSSFRATHNWLFIKAGYTSVSFYQPDNALYVYFPTSGGLITRTAAGLFSTGKWYHIAVEYNSSGAAFAQMYNLYVNGILTTLSSITGSASITGAGAFTLGDSTNGIIGLVDEVRVSDNIRYSQNFTPQTSPFVRDSNTKLLLHFDENGDDPRKTGKAVDDSGNGNDGTITGAKYVSGLVGIDSGSEAGMTNSQTFAGHSGVFVEEGTTNKITNPSFESSVFDTNWTASASSTLTQNTTSPYYKFGASSSKIVVSGANSSYITSITATAATHTLSAYVYNGTSGAIGGTVNATVAELFFGGAPKATTFTDMGGGWWRLTYSGTAIATPDTYGIEVKDGKTVYLDGVQLEAKSYATTYCDGSLGTGYAWDTPTSPNNSTGTRTVVSLAYSATQNLSATAGTVSFWIKTNWASTARSNVVPFVSSVVELWRTSNTTYLLNIGPSNTQKSSINTTFSSGTWQHIVMAYDCVNGSYDLYVNNTAGSHGTGSVACTIGNFRIGSYSPNDADLDGTFSDLRIYDSALSAPEVADMYYAGLGSHAEQVIPSEKYTDGEPPVLNWHLDEGTGTTAYDSSVFQNLGTLSSPQYASDSATGKFSLKFNGTTDNVSRTYQSDSELDPGTDNMSVSLWFKHPSTVSGTDTLLARYSSGGYKLYMNSSGFICFGVDDDSSWGPDFSACSTTSYADSKWHFVEATKTGSTSITLSIDGNSLPSVSLSSFGSISGSSPTLYLGIDSDGSSNPWDGFIDELKIYATNKITSQIHADYLRGSTQKGLSLQAGAGQQGETLRNGLVGYWKLDESSGNAADASGNNNTGTWNGTGSHYPAGKFGNGGGFNGTDDFINAGSNTVLDDLPNNNMTITGWMNRNVQNNNYPNLINKGWYLRLAGSSNPTVLDFIVPFSGSSSRTLSSVTTAGVWTHWAIVWNATAKSADIYLNGILSNGSKTAGSGSYTSDQSSNLQFGIPGMAYYSGSLDEMRVYNRALSPAEVRQLYDWAPGPIAQWKFEEGTGTSVADSSGYGNTGTWAGTGNHWTQGKIGKAGNFTATSSDFVSVANTISTNTVEFWAKPTTNTASMINLTATQYITASSGTISATNFTSPSYYINGVLTASPTLTANQWSHIVVTTNTAISANAITIGKANSAYTTGQIDDVRIYNYARSAKQIIEDMNSDHPAVDAYGKTPLAYYKFNEGVGSTAYNSGFGGATLNGNLGTGNSAPSWSNNGKFGKALSFDGTNNKKVSLPTIPTITAPYSVSLWFNINALSAGAYAFVSLNGSNTYPMFGLYANKLIAYAGDEKYRYGSKTFASADLNKWWHAVFVVDSSTSLTGWKIYLNGLDVTGSASGNSGTYYDPSTTGTIGMNPIWVSQNYARTNGLIDEVKIYNYALTLDEVKTEYNRGASLSLGSLSNTSALTGGQTASNSASASYCVPGDSATCTTPIAEWNFEEAKDNTCSGGVNDVCDTSGNANNGAWNGTGTTHWTQGKVGWAGKFNGSNDNINAGRGTSLNITSTITTEFWLYLNNYTGSQGYVGRGSPFGGWGVWHWEDNVFVVDFSDSSGNRHYVNFDKSIIPLRKWTHVTAQYDGQYIRTFINGVQLTPTNVGAYTLYNLTNSDLVFGLFNSSYLNGSLDQVRIFNYARTPAQIAWDYNQGKPIAQWKMNECSGTVIHDSSGNGNTGTLTNATAGTCTDGTGTTAWSAGASGKYNGSLYFDGTDHVSVANSLSTNSVAFWVKPTTNTASMLNLTATQYITAASGAISATNFTSPIYYINGLARTTPILAANVWNHVVVTTTTSITANAITVGKANSAYTTGQIEDVRFYNYPLTAVQVKTLYNEGSAVRFGP